MINRQEKVELISGMEDKVRITIHKDINKKLMIMTKTYKES